MSNYDVHDDEDDMIRTFTDSKTNDTYSFDLIQLDVNPAVKRRMNMIKFGDAKDDPPFPKEYVKAKNSLLTFVRKMESQQMHESEIQNMKFSKQPSVLICSHCGGEHLSVTCSKKAFSAVVIPKQNRTERPENTSVRITNLPLETHESDLNKLVESIGRISGSYLCVDKENKCKGSAFIHFHDPAHAAAAVKKLDGYTYAQHVLNVEFARPIGSRRN